MIYIIYSTYSWELLDRHKANRTPVAVNNTIAVKYSRGMRRGERPVPNHSGAQTVYIRLGGYSMLQHNIYHQMITPLHGNAFCITDPLWGASTDGQGLKVTVNGALVELSVVWIAMALMWRHCNVHAIRHTYHRIILLAMIHDMDQDG